MVNRRFYNVVVVVTVNVVFMANILHWHQKLEVGNTGSMYQPVTALVIPIFCP